MNSWHNAKQKTYKTRPSLGERDELNIHSVERLLHRAKNPEVKGILLDLLWDYGRRTEEICIHVLRKTKNPPEGVEPKVIVAQAFYAYFAKPSSEILKDMIEELIESDQFSKKEINEGMVDCLRALNTYDERPPASAILQIQDTLLSRGLSFEDLSVTYQDVYMTLKYRPECSDWKESWVSVANGTKDIGLRIDKTSTPVRSVAMRVEGILRVKVWENLIEFETSSWGFGALERVSNKEWQIQGVPSGFGKRKRHFHGHARSLRVLYRLMDAMDFRIIEKQQYENQPQKNLSKCLRWARSQ